MDNDKFARISVDDFNVSSECRDQLRRMGFATADEIIEIFDQLKKGPIPINHHWRKKCFIETIEALRGLGYEYYSG